MARKTMKQRQKPLFERAPFERRYRDPEYTKGHLAFGSSLRREWNNFDSRVRRGLIRTQRRILSAENEVTEALSLRTTTLKVPKDETKTYEGAYQNLLTRRIESRNAWRSYRLFRQGRGAARAVAGAYIANTLQELDGHISRAEIVLDSIDKFEEEQVLSSQADSDAGADRRNEKDPDHTLETLGEGGFGSVGLWVRQDRFSNITDRAAVKDTYMHVNDWEDEMYWRGDVNDRVPAEVDAMLALRGRTGSENVVRILKWQIFAEKRMYRIRMEFCPHGNLDLVLHHYMDKDEVIPEPVLWYLFSSLVDAALVMQQGRLDRRTKNWDWIVHRDLKPDNVYLGDFHNGDFAVYPQPKLGDFGLAVRRDDDEEEWNPISVNGGTGSRGFRAPEQTSGEYKDLPWPKLGSWTNVWGIGNMLFTLMNQQTRFRSEQTYESKATRRRPMFNQYGRQYSQELIGLVHECMRARRKERPKLRDLRLVLQTYMDADDDGSHQLASMMRDVDAQQRDTHVHRLIVKENLWPLDGHIKATTSGGRIIPSPPQSPATSSVSGIGEDEAGMDDAMNDDDLGHCDDDGVNDDVADDEETDEDDMRNQDDAAHGEDDAEEGDDRRGDQNNIESDGRSRSRGGLKRARRQKTIALVAHGGDDMDDGAAEEDDSGNDLGKGFSDDDDGEVPKGDPPNEPPQVGVRRGLIIEPNQTPPKRD